MGFKSYLAKNKARITKIYIILSIITIIVLALTLILAHYVRDPVIYYFGDEDVIHEIVSKKYILMATDRFILPVVRIHLYYNENSPSNIRADYYTPFFVRKVVFAGNSIVDIEPLFKSGIN